MASVYYIYYTLAGRDWTLSADGRSVGRSDAWTEFETKPCRRAVGLSDGRAEFESEPCRRTVGLSGGQNRSPFWLTVDTSLPLEGFPGQTPPDPAFGGFSGYGKKNKILEVHVILHLFIPIGLL